MTNIVLPIDFQQRMEQQLGAEYADFAAALASIAPVSIRQNPYKKSDVTERFQGEAIPWTTDAYYLPNRPVFTLDPAFHAGAYYVQEASSMLIGYALQQKIDFSKSLKILDLCAAPGGKSTLLASLMNEKSILLCNEVIKNRVSVLKENIGKWGNPNVMVSNHEVEEMGELESFFDVILIDAPCSGEGLFRKDENAKKEWSLDSVQMCATRQQKILSSAISLLKEGGVLVYSTCTYNDDENINNVNWIIQQFDCQAEKINIPEAWGIKTIVKNEAVGYQCFPHRVRGEGFFLSIFTKIKHHATERKSQFLNKNNGLESLAKKEAERLTPWLRDAASLNFYRKGNGTIVAVPKAIAQAHANIDQSLRRVSFGVELGEFKGHDFIPSHDLALSTLINNDLQSIDLSKEKALFFLKKELHQVDSELKGWTLARYEGLNLGWMKVLPNRINNYLPVNFRIRMDLPS
jgi:16S rRNA C967 or C1407 C5-methylase (RsmB/RsmF family)/NOL1/NOP2/fmu family ribosome biogenesis protein